MSDINKKVICINGDDTKLYEQVIFIMRESNINKNDNKALDFVSEAEKIINGYVRQEEAVVKSENKEASLQVKNGIQQIVIRKSKYEDIIINTLILVSCLGLSFALLYILK